MIRITAKTPGFRRCGVSHPATPTDYPDDKFSKADLKTLQDDPELVVEIITSEPGKKGTSAGNVQTALQMIQEAATVEALEEITQGDTRKGVLDAKAKRLEELNNPT